MSFFQCFVKVDKTIAYMPDEQTSTVSDLKTFVWDRFGINPSRQTLRYSGKTLTDDTILKDRVQQDGMIYVFPKTVHNGGFEQIPEIISNSNN